jgi:hypothetical protein
MGKMGKRTVDYGSPHFQLVMDTHSGIIHHPLPHGLGFNGLYQLFERRVRLSSQDRCGR